MIDEFGPLGAFVALAFAVAASGAALLAAFTGGSKWKPANDDFPDIWQRIAALIAIVCVVLTFFYVDETFLAYLLLASLAVALAAGLVYYRTFQSYRFVQYSSANGIAVKGERIILGGSELTPPALKLSVSRKAPTQQQMFRGFANDPDAVWTRESRMRVNSRAMVSYCFLLLAGGYSLGAVAILLGATLL